MDPTVSAPDDEQRVLRIGIMSATAGFWFVSLAPVIVASSDVHGLVMAFWRSWIGFAVLGVVVAARRALTWVAFVGAAPAGLCFGGSIGLFFWSSQLTSIANASLITVLQPIALMVVAYFVFSEQIGRRDVVWAGAAIAGAVILVLAGDSSGTGDIRGDLLALTAIIIGAGYFAFGKRQLETVAVLPFMVGMFAWAAAVLSAMVLVSGEAIVPPDGGEWIRVLAVAFFPGLGHVLLNVAQNKAPLNLMGVIQLLMPVNATLLAFWFLDQSVSPLQLVGMAVVIGALAVQTLTRSRQSGAGSGTTAPIQPTETPPA